MINTMYKTGDIFGVRFDFKGPVYRGVVTGAGFRINTTSTDPPFPTHLANSTTGYPYQLFRLPQKVGTVTFEMPRGTYIALDQSGFGTSGTQFATAGSGTEGKVTIMFAPSGALSSINYDGTPGVPAATVHFLVARQRTEATPPPILNDTSNYWVSIGNLTGNIATSETGFDGGTLPTISAANGTFTVAESRYYAVRYDQAGGGTR
jgi:hypothetical protein